jgi:hypothetical protein
LGPDRWRAIIEDRSAGSYQPNLTTYGDGSPVDDDDLDDLYMTFDGLTQSVRWQDGDLMLVDNLATAHGRNPYEGERDLQVALLG